MTHLPEPDRKAWFMIAAVFLATMFLWCCSLSFTPKPLQHSHTPEAEHTTEKYE